MDNLQASKLENCIFVKTILMLLVLLYHSCVFWTGNWFQAQDVAIASEGLSVIARWLNSFHIYGFTLVSGYLFSYGVREQGKYSRYGEFVKNKAERLLVPYWFAALIWVVPIGVYLCDYSVSEIVNKYILCTSPSQLWFLWMLFDVFVMVWPLTKILKKNTIALLLSAASWVIGLAGGLLFPNIFCIWTSFSYASFFILGMKLRENPEWSVHRISPLLYICMDVALFVLWLFLKAKTGIYYRVIAEIVGYLLHIVGAVMSFVVLQTLATAFGNWKSSKSFRFLSKCSMPVYLFHQQIIYFAIVVLNGRINPYINATLNAVISLVVSLIISSVLMNFPAGKVLVGERLNTVTGRKK